MTAAWQAVGVGAPIVATALTNGVAKTGLSGSSGSSAYYYLDVPASRPVSFVMSGGTGDADMYVRLVASVRPLADAEGAAGALGKALGLTLAEARLRLAPEPPAILASLPPEPAAMLVSTLRQAGLPVLEVEGTVASEGRRVVARTAVLGPAGATFQPRVGASVELPWSRLLVPGRRDAAHPHRQHGGADAADP